MGATALVWPIKISKKKFILFLADGEKKWRTSKDGECAGISNFSGLTAKRASAPPWAASAALRHSEGRGNHSRTEASSCNSRVKQARRKTKGARRADSKASLKYSRDSLGRRRTVKVCQVPWVTRPRSSASAKTTSSNPTASVSQTINQHKAFYSLEKTCGRGEAGKGLAADSASCDK